jgi:predicted MFS family arabinose efflux permease
MQTWMIKAAPAAVEAATALWVGVWSLAIGVGALVGGIAVDNVSLASAIWIAAALPLAAVLLVAFARSRTGDRVTAADPTAAARV